MKRDKAGSTPDVASPPLGGMGRARTAVADLAVKELIVHAGRAQAAHSHWPGARAPIGPARAPVELVQLVDVRGDDVEEPLTPLGHRTARLRLPRALADAAPVCRAAALRYQHVVEKVGAVGSGETGLLAGGSRRASDGGAVHRAALAVELRAFRACLGGVALPLGNARGRRQAVTVRALVDGVVLGGQEIKAVLRAHGWSGYGDVVRLLTDALHDALSGMADVQEPH